MNSTRLRLIHLALLACAVGIAMLHLGCRRATPPSPTSPTSTSASVSVSTPTIINAYGTYNLTYCARIVTISESPRGIIEVSFADQPGNVFGTYNAHSAHSRWMLYVEPDTTTWLYSGDVGLAMLPPSTQPPPSASSPFVSVLSAKQLADVGRTIPKTLADALPDSIAKTLELR